MTNPNSTRLHDLIEAHNNSASMRAANDELDVLVARIKNAPPKGIAIDIPPIISNDGATIRAIAKRAVKAALSALRSDPRTNGDAA